MKKLVALLAACCLAITPVAVYAEEGTTDILDNSAELAQVEENDIPTEAIVNEMKANADALYVEGKYEEAAVAYSEVARKANYLANIMTQCGEPCYEINGDSHIIPEAIREDVAQLEIKSNSLKYIRNTCYVYQGICYNKINDRENALSVLLDALDLIEASQKEIWTLAAEEVMVIIQYKTEEEVETNRKNRINKEIAKAKEKEEVVEYKGKTYTEFKERFGIAKSSRDFTYKTVYYYDGYSVDVFNSNDKIMEVKVD